MLLYSIILVLFCTILILCKEVNWIHRPGTNFSYYIHEGKGKFNFSEARELCQNLEPGVDIAVVHDKEEGEFIYNHTLEKNVDELEYSSVFHYVTLDKEFLIDEGLLLGTGMCTILIGKKKSRRPIAGKLLQPQNCSKNAHSFVCKKITEAIADTSTIFPIDPALPLKVSFWDKMIFISMVVLIVLVAFAMLLGICSLIYKMRLDANDKPVTSSSRVAYCPDREDCRSQWSTEMVIHSHSAHGDEFYPIREHSPDIPEPMYPDHWTITCQN